MNKLDTNRSFWKYFFLNLITCGIYSLWYYHCIAWDTNIICADDKNRTSGVLAYILLSFLTCGLYSIFWHYRVADMLAKSAHRRGVYTDINGTTVLICSVLSLFVGGILNYVVIWWITKALNTLSEDYNNKLEQ